MDLRQLISNGFHLLIYESTLSSNYFVTSILYLDNYINLNLCYIKTSLPYESGGSGVIARIKDGVLSKYNVDGKDYKLHVVAIKFKTA